MLGPLVLGSSDVLGSSRERAVVSYLALRAPRHATVDELIEALWGDSPPATAVRTLHSIVSRLRSRFPELCLERFGDGYRVALPLDSIDAHCFEQLVANGRNALADGRAGDAAHAFQQAESLWRGPAASDLVHGRANGERVRLDELRALVRDELAAARLASGEAGQAVADLEAAVRGDPLRERSWALLMRALSGAGRQADALRAYQRARAALADVGLEPSAELVSLERTLAAGGPASAAEDGHGSGIITLLLTDIEGSTAVWDRERNEMATALQRHDELVASIVAARGGDLRKTRGEGDSTFSVFGSPVGAIAAAVDLQRAVEREPWATASPLRVRVGLHSGEATLRDGDVYGPTVNRAARLRAAGCGGQTLVSGATVALVDELPLGTSLVALGPQLLAGFHTPIEVHELVDTALPRRPQPFRAERPSTLPIRLTSFIGRRRESDEVDQLLLDHRVVTLCGTGGVGKTRLAVEVADRIASRFAGGVHFVDLTATRDRDDVCRVLGTAAVARSSTDMESALASIATQLGDDALVVLDNCEQVTPHAAEVVMAICNATHRTAVLATSRQPLGAPGEHLYRLAPMPVDTGDAARLFFDRARAVDPHLDDGEDAVGELCRRLDGLPLALELAAACVDVLSPAQLAERLAAGKTMPAVDSLAVPARHRSLDAVLASSIEQLGAGELALFERWAVFRNPVSLAALEAVVTDETVPASDLLDLVARLVRRSLVVLDGSGAERRYHMLETIRARSERQLNALEDGDRWRDRHAAWAVGLLSEASAELDYHLVHWELVLDAVFDDLESALAWSALDSERAAVALPAVVATFNYWLARGIRRVSGIHWCTTLAQAADGLSSDERAHAVAVAAVVAVNQDPREAWALIEASRSYGELSPSVVAILDVCEGWLLLIGGDPAACEQLVRLAEPHLSGPLAAMGRNALVCALGFRGSHDEAFALSRAARDLAPSDRHMWFAMLPWNVDAGLQANVDRAELIAIAREGVAGTVGQCDSCASHAFGALALVDSCDDFGGPGSAARRALSLSLTIGSITDLVAALGAVVAALGRERRFDDVVLLDGALSAYQEETSCPDYLPGRAWARRQAVADATAAVGEDSAAALREQGWRESDAVIRAWAAAGS